MQFPKRVTIELTNRCNRHCTECPRHQMIYSQGHINPELYTKIIQQLPADTTIVPFYRGESLLYPDFPELIGQLNKFKHVQLATNGDYLTRPNQQAILNNCTFLSISLHDYRLPSQTNHTKFLKQCRNNGIETQVSILDVYLNGSRRTQFLKHWRRHVDRVRVYKTHSVNGFGSMQGTERPHGVPCSKPMEEMVVYWDGKVGLCNHDWNNLCCVGDLNSQLITEVWNSDIYEYIRKQHFNNNRCGVPSCVHCDFESNKIYGDLIYGE